jgi:hypothetical protein
MSTFDPMAAAIDWFDAYRAGSFSIVDVYAPTAELECGCGGLKIARGQAAISENWREQFAKGPAGALISLLPADDGISITYRVPDGSSALAKPWPREPVALTEVSFLRAN